MRAAGLSRTEAYVPAKLSYRPSRPLLLVGQQAAETGGDGSERVETQNGDVSGVYIVAERVDFLASARRDNDHVEEAEGSGWHGREPAEAGAKGPSAGGCSREGHTSTGSGTSAARA